MSTELTKTNPAAVVPTDVSASAMEMAIGMGDFSRLTPPDRLKYLGLVCESVGLNPLTKPIDIIQLGSKVVLYANKGAAEQLRKIHKVSIEIISRTQELGCYIVRVKATDGNGRTDEASGVVPIGDNVVGENRAIAIMKAETKAKRRVTLSICGLGMIDESEVEDMKNVTPKTEVNTDDVSLLNEPEDPAREKLLIDIASETRRIFPGQGVSDIKKKSDLWRECIGHPSWKTVESATIEELESGLEKMRAKGVEVKSEVIDVTPTAPASDDGDFGPAAEVAPAPKPEGSIKPETQDKLEILISEAGLDAVKFLKWLRKPQLPGGAHIKEGQALDYMIEVRAVKLMSRWQEVIRAFNAWVEGGMK